MITNTINGITSIIEFFRTFFNFIMNIFQGIYYALIYVKQTIEMEWSIIPTMPSWLTGFVIISMTMSIALIIAGRYRGK